jgi:large subunit ribosomal protein L4
MELEVYKKDGSKSGETVTLPPDIFGIEPNRHVMYRAVRVYLDNQRQGTADVKTRSEVRGGGKKPFKQKHTGPEPRDYSSALPAGLKRLARKSALSHKAKDGQIRVVEDFSFEKPRTAAMTAILKALALGTTKTLLLMAKSDRSVVLSGRNIPTLNVLEADKASTYDLLNNRVLLIQKSAVEVLQNTFKN